MLMEHLPPVGWADVATKRDLDVFDTRMNTRFERVDAKFVLIDRRFDEVDRRFEGIEGRLDQIDRRLERLEGLPGEFRSMLISVMTVMAVLFATMMGAVVAAIKI